MGVRMIRKGKRRIRELSGLVGALAVMFALMVWGATSAAAGGPTSVLVTSPLSGEATAVYFSDEEYEQLQELLGPPGQGTRSEPPRVDMAGARQINITWMVHDITPWRVDRVFPVSDKDIVWIHTAADVPNSLNGYWHRAGHPDRLRALLKGLGVMGEYSGEGYAGIFPAPWQSETVTPGPVAPGAPAPEATEAITRVQVASPGSGGGSTGWWWAIPGAAAGAVLALVLRPLAARLPIDRLRRDRDQGPRQELRDV